LNRRQCFKSPAQQFFSRASIGRRREPGEEKIIKEAEHFFIQLVAKGGGIRLKIVCRATNSALRFHAIFVGN
jgi:hypothetical protein